MARISNTDRYTVDEDPSSEDFLVGTDSQDSSKTKSYKIKDILSLGAGAVEPNVGTFKFTWLGGSGPSIEVYVGGELAGTVTVKDTELELDMSKSIVLVERNMSQPTFFLLLNEFNDQWYFSSLPPMADKGWFDSFAQLGVVTVYFDYNS